MGKTTLAVALRGADLRQWRRGRCCSPPRRASTVRDIALPFATAKRHVLVDAPGMARFFRIACVALSLVDDANVVVDGDFRWRAAHAPDREGHAPHRASSRVPRASAIPWSASWPTTRKSEQRQAGGLRRCTGRLRRRRRAVSVLDQLQCRRTTPRRVLSLPYASTASASTTRWPCSRSEAACAWATTWSSSGCRERTACAESRSSRCSASESTKPVPAISWRFAGAHAPVHGMGDQARTRMPSSSNVAST